MTTMSSVSGDISTWQSGHGHMQVLSDTTNAATRTVFVRDEHTGPQRFVRIRVTR